MKRENKIARKEKELRKREWERKRERGNERMRAKTSERVAQRTTADYNRSIVVSVPHDLRLVYRTRADNDDDVRFP